MLANEQITRAEGWSQFDITPTEDNAQKHLDISHKVAGVFSTTEGKEILNLFVSRYLLNDIVTPHDTQFAVGIKQGRADVVKQILAHIEISNNAETE